MDNETSASARRRSSSIMQHGGHESPSAGKKVHSPLRPSGIPEAEDDALLSSKHEESENHTASSSSDWEMDDMDDSLTGNELEDDEETGLTQQERTKRKKRKRRNTRIDERIAEESIITNEEKRLASQTFLRASLINAILIALWYTFSISISVYNKWMFSKGNLDFHYPLFTTCMHMLVQFCLSSLVLLIFPSLRPQHKPADYAPVPQASDEVVPEAPKKPLMTLWFYLTRISPCGAATGLDIGLGNTSLKFISLTFYTMCKSSVLAFVLIFAFLFRLEKPSLRLGGIIFFMTAGVVMMVAGETAFSAIGFILVMSAAFFSGFRWSLTQILLLRNPATSNPFSTLFFLTPVMFVALLVIALPVEGPSEIRAGFQVLAESRGTFGAVGILLFPGLLAFLMTASEFALLQRTSVVTLSVCGIFKEVLTISAAGFVFGDKLTPINISGLVVTISSIAAYNYIKIKKMREGAQRQAHQQMAAEGPMLHTADGDAALSGGDVSGHGRKVSHTAGLIRHSLSIPVRAPGEGRDRERSSPTKRPEDLE
ncbi:hypothetical protein MBLNU459_g4491t1 [Dothideomycetes sp. NU459]